MREQYDAAGAARLTRIVRQLHLLAIHDIMC